MVAENKTFDGMLYHNTSYFVSVRCINGGGAITQWNETKGIFMLPKSMFISLKVFEKIVYYIQKYK